ncbi:MAG: PQQ-binding-like beta-propeller repeat protein [Cyanobacteria bacterium P01_G01_bin.39]
MDFETGAELWKYQLEEKFFSDPVICEGIIYVSSLKFNGTLIEQYLRSVDIKSGQQLWQFKLEFQPSSLIYGSVPSSPVVSKGVVYLGGTDGYLYGIDISSAESIWTFKTTKNMPLTPPAFKNDERPRAADRRKTKAIRFAACTREFDIICVASGDGYLYAIELSTGQQKWKYEIGGLKPFFPSFPAIANQSVYIISSDNTFT